MEYQRATLVLVPTVVTITTIKTLFAHSSNVCAMRVCEEHLTDPKWRQVKAEIAHIRGEKPGSARYDPDMTDTERHAYENLILLCPNCHTRIDHLEPDYYTVELLEEMKYEHAENRNWAPADRLHELTLMLVEKLGLDVVAAADDTSLRNVAGVRAESYSDQPVTNNTPAVSGGQAGGIDAPNSGPVVVSPETIRAKASVPTPTVSVGNDLTALWNVEAATSTDTHDLESQDAVHLHDATHIDLTTGADGKNGEEESTVN